MTLLSPNYSPMQFAPGTGLVNLITGVGTGVDAIVLAANPARKRLVIANNSLVFLMTFNFGQSTVLGGFGLLIVTNPPVYWDSGIGVCPTDAIHVRATAGEPYTIMEW